MFERNSIAKVVSPHSFYDGFAKPDMYIQVGEGNMTGRYFIPVGDDDAKHCLGYADVTSLNYDEDDLKYLEDFEEGDEVVCVKIDNNEAYTVGKTYTLDGDVEVRDDEGAYRGSSWSYFMLKSRINFGAPEEAPALEVVVDNTPKKFGEMSDEEKGAILLARHEGRVLQWKFVEPVSAGCPIGRDWTDDDDTCPIVDHVTYRVKPQELIDLEAELEAVKTTLHTTEARIEELKAA